MSELSMQDKVVVVTGAAGGIGAALAAKMAGLGARVVVSDVDAERPTASRPSSGRLSSPATRRPRTA